MIHTVEYPDCPKCGREMSQCSRRLQRQKGEAFGKPVFWWECGWCQIKTPEEEDRLKALKRGLKWAKERWGMYED